MVRNDKPASQPEQADAPTGTPHEDERHVTQREAGTGASLDFCDEPSFMKHLECALSRSVAGQSNFLMHVDVCRAHDIRETSGSEALQAVQALVEDIVRELLAQDVPAWMRPECALTLLLTDTSPQTAAARARDVLTRIDDVEFHWEGHPFRLGAHIGLVELGAPAIPPHGWLALATETCKAAEELGGSGIRLVSNGAHAWRDLEADRAWHDHLAEII